MTILLVVIGAISLVIGFVQSSSVPIYISIACSVLAGAVLAVFSRMTSKSQQVVTSGGPTPMGSQPDRGDRTEPVPAFAGTGLAAGSSETESEAFSPAGTFDDDQDDAVADDDFPIERYDSRRVGEILPLLAELDVDELDLVREREEQGKSRATVLARIDQLIDQLEAEDRQEAATRSEDDDVDVAGGAPGDLTDIEEGDEVEVLPVPSARAASTRTTQAVSVAALPEDDGYFPIEEYDDLRASEILPLLPELDDDELAMVHERERAGSARPSILRRIEALAPAGVAATPPEPEAVDEPAAVLVPVAPPVAPTEVPSTPPRRAPAKRAAAAKKAPAVKKAPTVKAASRRAASPAAKVVPVVPVVPVTKAPAKKATRVTAKAPAPGPVKRAGPPTKSVKRVPAQKAAAAKVVPAQVVPAKVTAGKSSRPPAVIKAAKTVKAAKAAKAAKVTRKATKS